MRSMENSLNFFNGFTPLILQRNQVIRFYACRLLCYESMEKSMIFLLSTHELNESG